jgi:hypothetical protein
MLPHQAAILTGPEFLNIIDELKIYIGQELNHAQILGCTDLILGWPAFDDSARSRSVQQQPGGT